MSYKVLALKYRPQNFAAVVGQQPTLLALQNALANKQLHHAYLFTGTRGVGKTTLARILAKCLNCEQGITATPCDACNMCISITQGENPDVIEIDAASRTKVEDTRDLLDNVPYAPVSARFKIYIIDEVHMLSNHSFNALLKTLEEPPEHVKFILATTDPQKLPITVLSRCLQFHLRNLSEEQIAQHLAAILTQEQIDFAAGALAMIAQCANGSMRDALSLLEQVIAFGGREVTLVAAQQILGTSVRSQTFELLSKIIAGDAKQVIMLVRSLALNNADLNQVLKMLQTLIHQVALVQVVPDALQNLADNAQILQLSKIVDATELQIYYQTLLLGVRDLPYAPDIVTGFEMLMLRMIAFQPVQVNQPIITTPTSTAVTKPVQSPQPTTTAVAPPPVKEPVKNTTDAIATPQIKEPVKNITDWGQIILQLNLTGLTKVVAENCTVAEWGAESVTLILQENQRALLNAKHTERIQAALQEYLNNNVKLIIKLGATQTETPAAQGQRLQQAAHSAAEQAIRSDVHVKQLEQTFAAKIAEININEK